MDAPQPNKETEMAVIKARDQYFVTQALSEEIIFLKSFLRQQEKQITEYCEKFDAYIETTEIEQQYWDGYNEPELVVSSVEHIDGILESNYDLKGIFTEILPIYQRQAMLVSLWSRFEAKMADIIAYLHSEKNSQQNKRNKHTSMFTYQISELVGFGLSFDEKNLQKSICNLENEARIIRNCWVHDGGKPREKNIISLIDKTEFIDIANGLVDVSYEYLHEVADYMSLLANHIYHEVGIKRKL